MKNKKSPVIKTIIWICIILMVGSTIGVYIAYMFSPSQDDQTVDTGNVVSSENSEGNEEVIIIPELDVENPENTDAPILVTEDGEMDEMDQVISVTLENGETELVRLEDLTDAVQIN